MKKAWNILCDFCFLLKEAWTVIKKYNPRPTDDSDIEWSEEDIKQLMAERAKAAETDGNGC